MRILTVLGVATVAVLGLTTPEKAAAQTCTPVDSTLAMPFVDIKSLAASTHEQDVFDRQQLQIPTTDSSTIIVVTDTKICDKVLAAFKPTLSGSIPVPTKLFVIKVGNVYVALYPMVGHEKADIYRVLSKQYAVLSSFSK